MIVSHQGSDEEIILVSKVHDLLTRIYDILDNAISKWAGYTAPILAYLFNSTSRQCHEVWAL